MSLQKLFVVTGCTLLIAACSTQTSEVARNYEVLDVAESDRDQYWVVSRRVEPEYPIQAVSAIRSGCVALSYVINPEGQAEDIRVIDSYPPALFNRSAIAALEQRDWRSATPNNQAIRTSEIIKYTIEPYENAPRGERVEQVANRTSDAERCSV